VELNLAGKTALITGASQGIGYAIAKVLAAEGCHLHLAARNGAAMRELKKELAQYPVNVTVHEADLGTTEAMVALVLANSVLEKFGGDSLTETRRNVESYLRAVAEQEPHENNTEPTRVSG